MTPISSRTAVWIIAFGVAAICLASILVGWIGGHGMLTRVSPTFQAIVPTTALAFILLTVGLIGIGFAAPLADRVTNAAVWLAVGLVCLNVLTRIMVHTDGLDMLLPFWTHSGDRMSFATAILLIMAAALIRATSRMRDEPPLVLLGGALLGLTSVGSIAMSHGLSVHSPYRLGICDGMSLYTLLIFALIFGALMTIHLTWRPATQPEDIWIDS